MPHFEDFLKHYKRGETSPDSIDRVSELFTEKLPAVNIDTTSYEATCEKDEIFKELFEDVLNTSHRYTVDVATMEKYSRENHHTYDDERNELDQKRGRTHDAMISCVDILVRYIQTKNMELDLSWFTWQKSNRAGYGKFAILLTLNILKEEIILHKAEEIKSPEITKELNEMELIIINYVLTLSKIHEEKRQPTTEEIEKANSALDQLGKSHEDVLSGFYQIYKKRYTKKDIR